jgi:hypothetical protein
MRGDRGRIGGIAKMMRGRERESAGVRGKGEKESEVILNGD